MFALHLCVSNSMIMIMTMLWRHDQLFPVNFSLQAIWNWMDNYPEEFTELQKKPNEELAGEAWVPVWWCEHAVKINKWRGFLYDVKFIAETIRGWTIVAVLNWSEIKMTALHIRQKRRAFLKWRLCFFWDKVLSYSSGENSCWVIKQLHNPIYNQLDVAS